MATDSVLRPGELKEILLKEIEAADLAELDVREVGTVLEVKDGIARIYGLTSAMAGEMPEFTSSETAEEVPGPAPNPAHDNTRALLPPAPLLPPELHPVRRPPPPLPLPPAPTLLSPALASLGRPVA